MTYSFELGPIRPPSEAYSLLIRTTVNCPWNRCKFCSLYKGEKFQLRKVEDIKQDIRTAREIYDRIKELSGKSGGRHSIRESAGAMVYNPPNEAFRNVALWMYAGGESAFLQDANTLIMKTDELTEVIRYLKETFPTIKRITSYSRSKTVVKKTLEELIELRNAGLSRLHIGLESGYDPLLQYMDKGITSAEHITAGKRVVESGISLSEYVILGLGGKKWWREHATHTARILNEIDPAFIRIRTLAVNRRMPLHDEIEKGNFIRETDEQIIEEEKLLIEHLDCHADLVSDHITNLLQEIEGKLPEDKEKMLACIARFQALSPEERTIFKLGRRLGMYSELDDLDDLQKQNVVEHLSQRLMRRHEKIDDKTIYTLMERFI
jgi:hypothetical protein